MFPHADTIHELAQIRHQELLQLAARNRIAASAQRRGPSLFARTNTAITSARSWLNVKWSRRRGAPRIAPPVSSGWH